jgi:hypothetical protein
MCLGLFRYVDRLNGEFKEVVKAGGPMKRFASNHWRR